MNKIKVLQVIGNLKIGGAENVAMNYFRYIDREKYDFHYLVYTSEKGDYHDEVYELGGKVITIEYSPKKTVNFYKKLTNLMKKEKYDIVHSHTLFNSGIVLHAAKKTNVPKRIAHSHSTRNKVKSNYILEKYEKIMQILIKKIATEYIACSRQAGNYLYGKDFFSKFGQVLYNGIETSKFKFSDDKRKEIRKIYSIDDKITLIGHVGHIAAVKNQEYLLKILSKINNEEYMLMLIGDGKEKQRIQALVNKLGLEKKVVFVGNVSNVNEYLSAMDLFLFPSLYEGLPLAIVEAQTNGLKCIISNRISEDVIITDLVKQLPIEENYIPNWIDSLKVVSKEERSTYMKKVNDEGYEVREVVNRLDHIYSTK